MPLKKSFIQRIVFKACRFSHLPEGFLLVSFLFLKIYSLPSSTQYTLHYIRGANPKWVDAYPDPAFYIDAYPDPTPAPDPNFTLLIKFFY